MLHVCSTSAQGPRELKLKAPEFFFLKRRKISHPPLVSEVHHRTYVCILHAAYLTWCALYSKSASCFAGHHLGRSPSLLDCRAPPRSPGSAGLNNASTSNCAGYNVGVSGTSVHRDVHAQDEEWNGIHNLNGDGGVSTWSVSTGDSSSEHLPDTSERLEAQRVSLRRFFFLPVGYPKRKAVESERQQGHERWAMP